MFCGKCGKKLTSKEDVCKNCGTPAEYEEYCGGFHGLVKEEPAPERVPYIDHKLASSHENRLKEVEEEKMKRNTLILFSIIYGVLLIGLAVMACVVVEKISKQQNSIVDTQVQFEKNMEDIQEQNEQLLHYQSGQHGTDGNTDGICDGCGECLHLNKLETLEQTGDGTHSVVTICGDCQAELSRYDDACIDAVNMSGTDCAKDYICDICAGAVPCAHEKTEEKRSDETKTATHDVTCTECDAVVDAAVACTEVEGSDHCSVCGGCLHKELTAEPRYDKIPTSNKTHNTVTACVKCDKAVTTVEEECVDQDGDSVCDLCTGKITIQEDCEHHVTKWLSENGQHTKVCATCDENIGQAEACKDENSDGKCDICLANYTLIA